MPQLNLKKCTASGKTRYPTPGDAKEAMLKIKAKKTAYDSTTLKRIKRRNGKQGQCRYYYCKFCHGYHLTSKPTAISHNTFKKIFKERVRNTEGLVRTTEESDAWKADGLPFPEHLLKPKE